MASFRHAPSASATPADPVDYEAYAHVPHHRKVPSGDESARRERSLQIISKARTRDMRVLISLRAKTAQVSKGQTSANPIEDAMRMRADEATHAAAEKVMWNLKRRLASHAYDNFANADANASVSVSLPCFCLSHCVCACVFVSVCVRESLSLSLSLSISLSVPPSLSLSLSCSFSRSRLSLSLRGSRSLLPALSPVSDWHEF